MDYRYSNIIGMEKLFGLDDSFSWDRVNYIDSIQYYISHDETSNNYSVLIIDFRFSVNGLSYKITVKFSSVVNLSLERIGGEYNQISGFEITDKTEDGWEKNNRFLVNDYEDGSISFICKDIEVISVSESVK